MKVFDTLFTTNHKFYGLADLFLNIPLQTDGRGLQDLAVKWHYTPMPKLPLNELNPGSSELKKLQKRYR